MSNGDDTAPPRTTSRLVQAVQSPAGTVTYRAVLGVAVAIILSLIATLGNQIMAEQTKMASDQNKMLNTLTNLTDQIATTTNQTNKNTDQLNDHEHRITVLEVKEGQEKN